MGYGLPEDTQNAHWELTALEVARAVKARKAGMLNDGGGLYLKSGSSWIYRYALNGRKRDLGLGPALDIGLADARGRAAEARRLRLDARDPIEARRASWAALAPAITFAQAAEAYMEAHRAGWRSEKHRRQWESSLANYVYPVIGNEPVGAVGVADVLRVLKPIWQEKPETGSRVRNRIDLVLDSAKARGLRSGENPATWRGHLDKLLPRRSKMGAVKHFAALDYREIAGFMTDLAASQDLDHPQRLWSVVRKSRPPFSLFFQKEKSLKVRAADVQALGRRRSKIS